MKSATETEVKIPLPDRAVILDRLHHAGFRVQVPRLFEVNTLFDTGDQTLRRAGELLRLREAEAKFSLTWKGPPTPGSHKSRPELETTVGSADVFRQIFEKLGYSPTFRYEKYRTEFVPSADPEAGTVTVDETPIGDFMEIEGPGDWIDTIARQLGFGPADYVLESYGKLYLQHCERHDVHPENMVFGSHR